MGRLFTAYVLSSAAVISPDEPHVTVWPGLLSRTAELNNFVSENLILNRTEHKMSVLVRCMQAFLSLRLFPQRAAAPGVSLVPLFP